MKLFKKLAILFASTFLLLICFSTSAQVVCDQNSIEHYVLVDKDCPGQPGQIYTFCQTKLNKCCNATEAEGCNDNDL